MPTVGDTIKLIQAIAPEEFAYKEGVENVGLIIGRRAAKAVKVMCCLDVSNRVIDEAVAEKVGLIISHHPLIFMPISSVSCEDVLGRKILRLIENKIAVYASHTNLDFVADGINDYVANLIGLKGITVLDPYIGANAGFGRAGDLFIGMTAEALRKEVAHALNDPFVRVIGERTDFIKRVAVINGGGGGETKYIDMARDADADCLITADVKHHVAEYALDCGFTIIEPQHHTMEFCYIQKLVQLLQIKAKEQKLNIEIIQASSETNIRS